MSDQKEWPWPEWLDAVLAAPQHHQLIFENDRVRVLNTVIPAGDTVPVHTHRWPAVYYTIERSHFIRRDAEGRILFDSRNAPPMPGASFLESLPPHSVENVGDTPIRLISFEMKE
jgi:hypothetical protein